MTLNAKEIGTRILNLRESKHESQEAVAQQLSVARPVLTRIESGKRFPSLAVLVAFAEYYHVTTDYLLFGAINDPEIDQEIDLIIAKLKAIQRKI